MLQSLELLIGVEPVNVFLIQASIFSPETERSMPLGIMYLAAHLRERFACRVGIFDMQLKVRNTEPVLAAIEKFGPDLIGISGMALDMAVMNEVARRCKERFPSIPLIVGGVHATNTPAKIFAEPAYDYLIRGEGEHAFGAFIEHLRGRREITDVPNLMYRDNGDVRENPQLPFETELDQFSFPAYDLIDLPAYHRIPRCGIIYAHPRYAAIITSRGCPYHCGYCHKIHGDRWRPRSAENVVEEMIELRAKYDVGEFIIMDDMFNLSAERCNRIAELIIAEKLNIRLSFPIGLRGDIMQEETVRLLKRAGMYRCMYAVETASPRLQKLIRKNNNLEKLRHIIEYTRRQGVMVHGSFMLGFPTESEEEARATVNWAVASALHTAAFYRVIPYEGTMMANLLRESGVLLQADPSDLEYHKSDKINASPMPDKTLSAIRRSAYRRFYLSPKRLWNIVRALPNRRHLLPRLALHWVRRALVY